MLVSLGKSIEARTKGRNPASSLLPWPSDLLAEAGQTGAPCFARFGRASEGKWAAGRRLGLS